MQDQYPATLSDEQALPTFKRPVAVPPFLTSVSEDVEALLLCACGANAAAPSYVSPSYVLGGKCVLLSALCLWMIPTFPSRCET